MNKNDTRGYYIDILKSVPAARIQSWVDGSCTGSYPLGGTSSSDEAIIASLPYQALGHRVEYIHIERYVLTTYLDGTKERQVSSAVVFTSQKYRVARIPGESKLRELRRQYAREIPVHESVRNVMHIFADAHAA